MATTGTLTVQSPQKTLEVTLQAGDERRDLADILRSAGLPLNTRCGRQGLCEGCLIDLLAGTLTSKDSGPAVCGGTGGPPLRACQYTVSVGDHVEIRVPARSLLAHEPQIVSSFRCNVTHAYAPLWRRLHQRTAELDSHLPLSEALCRAVARRLDEPLPVLGDAALEQLRPNGDVALALEYRGDHWILRPLTADPASVAYGVAVDVGTTTVVVLLVDLATGHIVATASALNAQVHLGDNVLTRINLCLDSREKLLELQQAVTEKTLGPLLDQVLTEAGAHAEQVVSFSVAGNTTMLHLLAGVDPSCMGFAPFTPVFLEHRALPFAQLPITTLVRVWEPDLACETAAKPTSRRAGRAFGTDPLVHLLPSAAAYVGADITSGVFSSGMAYQSETSLLADIGTNGEIVLKHRDQLLACATAAGPAFEGAGLTCGVRAGSGAISHIRLAGDPLAPVVEVIGGGKPIGLCGTAYVDFVAQARRHGLIGATGRITPDWATSDLVRMTRKGRGFLIAEGRGKEPLFVAEADIASLLQAKAAIATGILCLLRRLELQPRDIDTLYLAGGFGFHMDLENLIGCGLLPGFLASQIQVVGNTALAGAYLALLDASAIEEMKRIARQLHIVELNLEPDFISCYIDQLWLP